MSIGECSTTQEGKLRIVQGNLELEARLLEASESSLKAPDHGDMTRTIYESVSCQVFYRFRKGERTFFHLKRTEPPLNMNYENIYE